MATPTDLLANAERLISDAEYLLAGHRSRSAATLIVVALEQMGAFVEVLTKEEHQDASVHMGIFGKRTNAHAKRQDALAAHVMNFAMGNSPVNAVIENYIFANGHADGQRLTTDEGLAEFISWVNKGNGALSEKQKQEQRECPDIATAHLLLHVVRTNRLKKLREYGLYEDASQPFSEAAVRQIIDLAAKVREILTRSWVVPEVIQLAGINMATDIVLDMPDATKPATTPGGREADDE